MLADYRAGMHVNDIATKYNVHPTAAGKSAKRDGIPLRQENQPLSAARAPKRDWQRKNSEKRKAHKTVERAIAAGDLERKPCERCGDPQAQAHHEDYSKPLEVNWLCAKDHKARHREMKRAVAVKPTA